MTPNHPFLSVEEALEKVLDLLSPLAAVTVPLESSLGLVLAESVVARESHPAHETSAMDGYAVRAEDLEGADPDHPVILPVVCDVAAGLPSDVPLEPGQAFRISTGGVLPEGADAVVMREDVDAVGGERVVFRSRVERYTNVRHTGEHVREGETILHRGTLLGPAHLSMGAYLGVTEWSCIPRPKISVLSTGTELVEAGQPLRKGQVRDSNSIALVGSLSALGCDTVSRARVPDHPGALDEALGEAFQVSDVVITSGGISAGWHDHVRGAIEKRQGRFLFHKLKMRPGKPLGFGVCEGTVFFCLPGNPVSSLVTFELFVKPALEKMMGRPASLHTLTATLSQRLEKKPGAAVFFRGVSGLKEGRREVRTTGPQGSHMLRSLVEANVLIQTREEDGDLEAGTQVTIRPLTHIGFE